MDRLAAMEVFVRVVETGSFSAAARQLRIGQPAVSKTVAQLEERLGVRLLVRSTRGLTPTEAGQNFYERAKRAVDEADRRRWPPVVPTRVCQACCGSPPPSTFARLHVVPRLGAFLAEHPALSDRCHSRRPDHRSHQSGVDVALRMGSLEDSALTARKIGQSPRRVLGAPAYFEKHGEPKVPADLTAHKVIEYDMRGGGAVWAFRKGSTETSVTVNGRVCITAARAYVRQCSLVLASPSRPNGCSLRNSSVDWSARCCRTGHCHRRSYGRSFRVGDAQARRRAPSWRSLNKHWPRAIPWRNSAPARPAWLRNGGGSVHSYPDTRYCMPCSRRGGIHERPLC